MSRTLRKAVENAKQKKETEINLVEEGIAHLEEVPELFILHNLTKLCLSHNKIVGKLKQQKAHKQKLCPPLSFTVSVRLSVCLSVCPSVWPPQSCHQR
jgi:hypothetical protein